MKLKYFFVLIVSMFFTTLSFADIADPVATGDFLMELIKSLGGLKGASALAIAGVVSQVLMKFFQTSLAEKAGKYRLIAVAFFSMAAGIVAMKMSGLDWSASLMHSSTLLAFQVLFNQVYKQFFEKKD